MPSCGRADEAEDDERTWREQARVVFMTVLGAGLRRGEILGLRWKDVALADPDGAVLRVRETFVRDRIETPKSEAGERTIALDAVLADELFSSIGHGRSTTATTRAFSATRRRTVRSITSAMPRRSGSRSPRRRSTSRCGRSMTAVTPRSRTARRPASHPRR